jgi:N utilization substance protein B
VAPLPGGRRKSREIVFRVLYETDISGEDPLEALEYALGRYRLTEDGREHAVALLRAWWTRREQIDGMLRSTLARWDLARLSPVVRAVLRLSTAELLEAGDVPARVIFDQAVELAKKYGEEGADGFVNGVLDPIGAVLRPKEITGDGRTRRPGSSG